MDTLSRDREILFPLCYHKLQMNLEKIQESTITKTIFATIAVSALVTTMLVFPSFGHIVRYFSKNQKQDKYVRKVFRKLEKQELISIGEKPDGQITVILTDKGKRQALTYKIDKMKIPKPKQWDGIWRLVVFDVPEKKKQARDLFRQNLKKLGFYHLQKSIFVHPYPCKREVDFLKHNFAIAQYVTLVEARSIENQNLLRNHFQV